MRKTFGIAAGVLNHAMFAVTAWLLFLFLHGDLAPVPGSTWIDVLLALQFVVVHSMLLTPGARRWIGKVIPSEFFGTLFCSATCAGLLVTIGLWRTSPVVLWNCEKFSRGAIEAAFFGSWGLMFYSLYVSGLGYQTGFVPWWNWVRNRPAPPREFAPRSLYLWLRHPVYLSVLGVVWLTPTMTLDRAVLTTVWTTYVFVGSWLKDRRLVHYLGDTYRLYQARVRGYPGMLWGPLGRIPLTQAPIAAGPPPVASLPRATPARLLP